MLAHAAGLFSRDRYHLQFSPLRTKTEAEHCFLAVLAVSEVCNPRSGCCFLRLEQTWPHSFKQTSYSVKYMWPILNIKPEKEMSAIYAEHGDLAKGGMFAEDNLLLDMFCGQNKSLQLGCWYALLFSLISLEQEENHWQFYIWTENKLEGKVVCNALQYCMFSLLCKDVCINVHNLYWWYGHEDLLCLLVD